MPKKKPTKEPKKKEEKVETPEIVVKEVEERVTFRHPQPKEHPYMGGIEKFNGKTVEVKDVFGDKYRGTCIGINKQHLNVLMETADEIVIIKNPQIIRRDKE